MAALGPQYRKGPQSRVRHPQAAAQCRQPQVPTAVAEAPYPSGREPALGGLPGDHQGDGR